MDVTLYDNSTARAAISSEMLPHEYYRNQVVHELTRIESILTELKHDLQNKKLLTGVMRSAENVADLAMIHGYEGVESIAEKVRSSTHRLLEEDIELDDAFPAKTRIAVAAIYSILRMENDLEGHMTLDRFDEHIEIAQNRIRTATEKLSQNFDRLFRNQIELPFEFLTRYGDDAERKFNANQEDHAELFDIREIDSLLNLDNGSQESMNGNSHAEETNGNAHEEKAGPIFPSPPAYNVNFGDPDDWEKEEQDEPEDVESFNGTGIGSYFKRLLQKMRIL